MRRIYMTCPLWSPTEPPPPPEEQIGAGGYSQAWVPTHCAFAMPADPDHPWIDGSRTDSDPAWLARNYRCITHNRRPTIHQRSWNADHARERLLRAGGAFEQIRLTDNVPPTGYDQHTRPYPDTVEPERRRPWGVQVWVRSRPMPPTLHSTW